MTTATAISILEAGSELVASGERGTRAPVSADELRQLFGTELAKHEPFKSMDDLFLSVPNGGMSASYIAKSLIWEPIAQGVDPANLLTSAIDVLERNSYEVLEIRPVKGITVEKKVDLADGAYLLPNKMLPQTAWHQIAFSRPGIGESDIAEAAALVRKILISPALPSSAKDNSETLSSAITERNLVAERMRLAFGLTVDGPVEMPTTYFEPFENDLFGAVMGIGQKPSQTFTGKNLQLDVAKALHFYDRLKRIERGEALELSIARLIQSRLPRSIEDRIIDLGMAIEIALMHNVSGRGDGKSEITNRISSRAAWLLGTTPAERLAIAKDASELYGARSSVVHTGRANAKLRSRLQSFDKLAGDVARAILVLGRFPDWKALVLGAETISKSSS